MADNIPPIIAALLGAGSPQQRDRHEMAQERNTFAMNSFIDSLDAEQSLAVLHMCAMAASEGSQFASSMMGRVMENRRLRLGLCPNCNENHGAELDDIMRSGAEEKPDHPPMTPEEEEAARETDEQLELNIDFGNIEISNIEEGFPSKQDVIKADEYNVRIEPNGRVTCLGQCSETETVLTSTWPNLEDRMLRPPGTKGCNNCQLAAKWG